MATIKDWQDINLGMFQRMNEISTREEEIERVVGFVALFNDMTEEEVLDLPLDKFKAYIKEMAWMNTPPEPAMPREDYVINGKDYKLTMNFHKLTTAQYIDFQGYSKSDDYSQMLSVFLIPKGHKYGDGYDVYEIDPASIHCIYRNYHIPKITDHRWYLARFVDRATNTSEAPMWNGRLRYYVIEFNPDGTMSDSGVNSLHGTYHLDHGNISIHIQPVTEIYDATGWEDRIIDALNAAIKCDISEDHIRIYYNYTNTYMEFRALDESLED